MHEWGDGFDFDRLDSAGRLIAELYQDETGQRVNWKEKYGTLRFEAVHTWLRDDHDILTFLRCVICVTERYPDIAAEILDDVAWCMTGNIFDNLQTKNVQSTIQ